MRLQFTDILGTIKNVEIPDRQFEDALDGKIMDVWRGKQGLSRNPGHVPELMERVRARCRVKHYSLRTEQAYVAWIWRFMRANGGRHPRDLGGPEVEAFLTRLATDGKVAPSTQNQALAGLLFFYREVLGVDLPCDGVGVRWSAGLSPASKVRRSLSICCAAWLSRATTSSGPSCACDAWPMWYARAEADAGARQ